MRYVWMTADRRNRLGSLETLVPEDEYDGDPDDHFVPGTYVDGTARVQGRVEIDIVEGDEIEFPHGTWDQSV